MDRRTALKQLAIASGGLITLPAWMGCDTSGTPATHLSSFSSAEQQVLAAITDAIIPAADPAIAESIGALSVGVDKFLQKLFDDCYDKEVQNNIKTQLKALDDSAIFSYKRSFTDCTATVRKELLLKFSGAGNKQQNDFFKLIKTETIRGFNTSQEVMEKYLNYKVAPGHYYGCIDLKA